MVAEIPTYLTAAWEGSKELRREGEEREKSTIESRVSRWKRVR